MLQLLLFTNSGVISSDQTHVLKSLSERIKNNDSYNNTCAFALNNNEWKKYLAEKMIMLQLYLRQVIQFGHKVHFYP